MSPEFSNEYVTRQVKIPKTPWGTILFFILGSLLIFGLLFWGYATLVYQIEEIISLLEPLTQ